MKVKKDINKGLLQIYTGEGKGKTTAALGLAIRAAGQGLKVLVVQFLKSPRLSSGELKFIDHMQETGLQISRLNTPWWSLSSFKKETHQKKMRLEIESKLILLHEQINEEGIDLLILDELNVCLHHGLLEITGLLKFLDSLNLPIEIVITGRNAPAELIERADLVTEMKMIKHPYTSGVKARKGIEY